MGIWISFDVVKERVSVLEVLRFLGWNGEGEKGADGWRLAGPFSSRGINAGGRRFHVAASQRAWFDHGKKAGGNVLDLWRRLRPDLRGPRDVAIDLCKVLGRDDVFAVSEARVKAKAGKGVAV